MVRIPHPEVTAIAEKIKMDKLEYNHGPGN
jgi:hypothetical protein